MYMDLLFRPCGTCTACCITPSIAEGSIAKPPNVPCKHCVVGQGCGKYEARPRTCRKFSCEWKRGRWPDDKRPDLSHILQWRQPDLDVGEFIVTTETEPGALKSEFGREAVANVLRQEIFAVTVTYEGLHTLKCPPSRTLPTPVIADFYRFNYVVEMNPQF